MVIRKKFLLTENDYHKYENAVEILGDIMNGQHFDVIVKTSLGEGLTSKDVKDIRNLLGVFDSVLQKSRNKEESKKSKKEGGVTKDENKYYFTRSQPSTPKSRSLYKMLEETSNINFVYPDQDNETCPTDIRKMFKAYVEQKSLKNGATITIDDYLRELLPHSLGMVTTIYSSDKKIPHVIWKEVLTRDET